ncbi:hypothetical protein PgNI_05513 [Pyricularia grisea]|uniref:Uncharacterized protein n=1 Tax=Pyricularia grisea TaxID=148305 RepID=A0A6P8B3Y9_PYRGI|nr:hypothetical protein PgNI_05513 [Pyricularia grisea]TLD09960.1 hypothetical protein PgNI_05513 [Pyricularia grisea]
MGVPEYWPRDASGRHGVIVRVACDGESAGNASSVRNNDARLKIALIDNASSPRSRVRVEMHPNPQTSRRSPKRGRVFDIGGHVSA